MQNFSEATLTQLRNTLTNDRSNISAELTSIAEQIVNLQRRHTELETNLAKNRAAMNELEREVSFRRGTPAQLAARRENWEELLKDWIGVGNMDMVRRLHPKRERILHSLKLCTSGAFAETQQRCLCIMMPSVEADANAVTEMEVSLGIVIPHIQPVERWCIVSILESNARSPECHLRFAPDRSIYQIVTELHGHKLAKFETSSLSEALSYIQSHHSFHSNTR